MQIHSQSGTSKARSKTKTKGARKKPADRKAAETTPADAVVLSKPAGGPISKAKPSPSQQIQANLAVNVSSSLPATIAGPIAQSFQTGFVDGYLTPQEIRGRCLQLAKEFPHLVDFVSTGIQTHGYDGKNEELHGASELFYLRIGPRTAERDKKTGIFQYAAPHARERINPMSMMELTEQLVRNYDPASQDPKVQANTKLLQDLDIFVAINTNPDGHNFATYDDPMWRKNRAPIGEGHFGVDINRNYPYQWEPSTKLSGQTFSGVGPASEPETQALLQVIEKHPNIKFVVDWHSYGQEIRRPLGTTPDDDKYYDQMHGRVSDAMKSVAGNDYKVVVSQVIQGTSDDHFYHQHGIYSTVMETGLEFIPPEDQALVVMYESVEGAREFLRVAQESKGLG